MKRGSMISTAPVSSPVPVATCSPWAPTARFEPVVPEYPEIARMTGAVGVSGVVVALDSAGTVVSARLVTSAGNVALDASARNAALSSRFEIACASAASERSHRFFVEFDGRSVRVYVDGVPYRSVPVR